MSRVYEEHSYLRAVNIRHKGQWPESPHILDSLPLVAAYPITYDDLKMHQA